MSNPAYWLSKPVLLSNDTGTSYSLIQAGSGGDPVISLAELKKWFSSNENNDGFPDDLNWLFLGTSGVHGGSGSLLNVECSVM